MTQPLTITKVLVDEIAGRKCEDFAALKPRCSCCDRPLTRMAVIASDDNVYGRDCFATITGAPLPKSVRRIKAAVRKGYARISANRFFDPKGLKEIVAKEEAWPVGEWTVSVVFESRFAHFGEERVRRFHMVNLTEKSRDAAMVTVGMLRTLGYDVPVVVAAR